MTIFALSTSLLDFQDFVDSHGSRPRTQPSRTAPPGRLNGPASLARSRNIAAFEALDAEILRHHGEVPRYLTLRQGARRAISRLPVPILGPGMTYRHVRNKNGAQLVANFFQIMIDAERSYQRDRSCGYEDAFVRSFAAFRSCSVSKMHAAIVECLYICEFFSPEFARLLESLEYRPSDG